MVNKKTALRLALDSYLQQVRDAIAQLEVSLNVYEASEVIGLDTVYWFLPDPKDDYWYVQHPADQNRPMQTGGDSRYFAVSKQTGALHVIIISGE